MFNLCVIIGRLTKDVELKQVGDSSVANFTMATNKKFGDKEEVCFFDVVVWGKLGDICAKYLHKGSLCMVSGRQRTESWEKDGVKQYRSKVIANEVKFLDPKTGGMNDAHDTAIDDGEMPF